MTKSEIYTRYVNYVAHCIRLYTDNNQLVEDLVQDCFIRIYKAMDEGRVDTTNNPKPYIWQTARSTYIDYYRKKVKEQTYAMRLTEQGAYFDINDGSFERMEMSELDEDNMRMIKSVLPLIDPDQREVLQSHLRGERAKDIAKRTGVSINTVVGRKRYAIRNIKKLLNLQS